MAGVPRAPHHKEGHGLWDQCGFLAAGDVQEDDRQPTWAGHKLDSFLLNAPLFQ